MTKSYGVKLHIKKDRLSESSPREKERWDEKSPSERAMG